MARIRGGGSARSRFRTRPRRVAATMAASGPDSAEDRATLARELLGVCMNTLKGYGLRAEHLTRLAAQAAGSSGRITRANAVLAEAKRLADTANKWLEDPAYRDATGRPAVLPVRHGPGCSFAALAREFFADRNVADVVALGCNANVFEKVGTDKVALLNSTVLFTGSSLPILAYSIRTVRRFLGTADFNRRARSPSSEGWPDRTSFVEVSEAEFREFIRVFRPQISSLIEMSNRWMFQRSRLSANRGRKKRLAGLQVFVFRD